MRVYFVVFLKSLEFFNYVCRVFKGLIGGTPDKCIPEGIVFIGIIGGTRDKRIPEGLF